MEQKNIPLVAATIFLLIIGLRFINLADYDLMSAQLLGVSGNSFPENSFLGNPSIFSSLMSMAQKVDRIPKITFDGAKTPAGNLYIGSADNLVYKFKVNGDKKQDVRLYQINVFAQFGNNLISLEKPAIKEVRIYDADGRLVGYSDRIVPEYTGAGIVFIVPTDVYLAKKDKINFTVEADIERADSGRVLSGAKFWITMSPQDINWITLDGELWGVGRGNIKQPRSGLFTVVK